MIFRREKKSAKKVEGHGLDDAPDGFFSEGKYWYFHYRYVMFIFFVFFSIMVSSLSSVTLRGRFSTRAEIEIFEIAGTETVPNLGSRDVFIQFCLRPFSSFVTNIRVTGFFEVYRSWTFALLQIQHLKNVALFWGGSMYFRIFIRFCKIS